MPAVSPQWSTRAPVDRCPGALRPHQAVDGALVRVRLPGGQIGPEPLRALAAAARRHGDGALELTSRANVQLRGLTSDAVEAVAEECADAGLLPSATHERVRNLLGSPLSGRDGAGAADIRPLLTQLDAALCADPALAALPGRFLFALDDGRGDVTGLGADVAWQAGTGLLLLAGQPAGRQVPGDQVVGTMLAAARAFLAHGGGRDGRWRISELPGGAGAVEAALAAHGWGVPAPAARPPVQPAPAAHPWRPPAPGLQAGGATACAVLTVPLGRLAAAQATLLAGAAATAGGGVVVTPWRSVVVDLDPTGAAGALRRLTSAGLVADPGSPWVGLSACAGPAGCAHALADVRADATALAAAAPGGGVVHWAGCQRRCGQPAGPVLVAVATGAGYRLTRPDGPPVTAGSGAAARAYAASWRHRSAA